MKNILLNIVILTLLFLTSCKEYLDVKPHGKVIPETAEEFNSVLQNHLWYLDYGFKNVIIGAVEELRRYEGITPNLDASIYGKSGTFPFYIGRELNTIMKRYADYYEIIRDANIVLDNIEATASGSDKVMATAYTMRGIAYYHLLRNYCKAYNANENDLLGVPLVIHFDIEERAIRADYEDVVNQIYSDLENAIKLNNTVIDYRLTADVAKFFLCRLAFWVQDWDKVIEIGEPLLSKYPLLSGAQYVNMIQSEHERLGNVLLKAYLYEDSSSKFKFEAIKQTTKNRPVSADFINLFVEQEKDIRYTNWFNAKREVTKTICPKLRIAELHLMVAEAYVHINDDSKALLMLNELRDNRIEDNIHFTAASLPAVNPNNLIKVDCTDSPLSKLMCQILIERQKELFFEGDYWYELKRNGCPEFWTAWKDGLKYETKKYMYTAPILRLDVEMNDGLIQNEGYEK